MCLSPLQLPSISPYFDTLSLVVPYLEYRPLILVFQTPYHGQKALPELASTILYPPTSTCPLYSNNDDFLFSQHAKLFPTSGALPCCSLFQECTFPKSSHSQLLLILELAAQMSSSQRGLL